MHRPTTKTTPRWEAPTLALIGATYLGWALITVHAEAITAYAAVPLLALVLVLHSSLCHEAIHGHPTPHATLNAALMSLAVGLFVPFERFRDTHLAHHRDEHLTDPYDDPESNYLDPACWAGLSPPMRGLLRANNTLLGRMVLGPAIGLIWFWHEEALALAAGTPGHARAWALHLLGLIPVALWLTTVATLPPSAYLLAAYTAMGILKIRTFLEHRAHEAHPGRSVIVEDRGPLAFLFLNNNLHAVHHGVPGLAWYRLPAFYRTRREAFLQQNRGYLYSSYAAVFCAHALTAKDPVAHPLRNTDPERVQLRERAWPPQ
ncbi:MAG: fatty acid desaturase [Pseudomonadota bacterium]